LLSLGDNVQSDIYRYTSSFLFFLRNSFLKLLLSTFQIISRFDFSIYIIFITYLDIAYF
jgi:hypothetical protein